MVLKPFVRMLDPVIDAGLFHSITDPIQSLMSFPLTTLISIRLVSCCLAGGREVHRNPPECVPYLTSPAEVAESEKGKLA